MFVHLIRYYDLYKCFKFCGANILCVHLEHQLPLADAYVGADGIFPRSSLMNLITSFLFVGDLLPTFSFR